MAYNYARPIKKGRSNTKLWDVAINEMAMAWTWTQTYVVNLMVRPTNDFQRLLDIMEYMVGHDIITVT